MAESSYERWNGPGSRVGNARPIPGCVSIALRLFAATGQTITPDMADKLGVSRLSPDAPVEERLLAGIFAECINCPGIADVKVDRIGRIVEVDMIPGYPNFTDVCHTIAGCALMSSFQNTQPTQDSTTY